MKLNSWGHMGFRFTFVILTWRYFLELDLRTYIAFLQLIETFNFLNIYERCDVCLWLRVGPTTAKCFTVGIFFTDKPGDI